MSSLSKLILILGKARITECQIGAVGELSHLGDLIFHQKTLQETWCMSGPLLWWSCQSPVAHSCRLLNSQNSFHGGMFKLNTKSDADSLLYSLSHFECDGYTAPCSLNGVYRPHWLVQWSHDCSCMCIPVQSPWLPGYTDVVQAILVILTTAGLFQDRPCIGICTPWYKKNIQTPQVF